MSTGITIDDDVTIPLDGFEGDRPRGCQWDESVCTAAPGYRIVGAEERHGDHTHEAAAAVYCPRHYALALARLVEAHPTECTTPLAAHAVVYGSIGGAR